MQLRKALILIHQFACAAIGAELRIQIPASNLISNPSILPASTHATLIGPSGESRALIRKDNTIVFPEISSKGSHLLKIYTRDYVFASYRLDTITTGTTDSSTQIAAISETYPGTQWSDRGIALIPAESPVSTYTLVPKALAKKTFYEERPGFSILILLKNPMILLGGVALLFTFGMPKLLENMDPEMRAEFEEMQKSGPTAGLSKAMAGQSPGGSANFDLAGYLAGSGSNSKSTSTKTTGREAAAGNARERKR